MNGNQPLARKLIDPTQRQERNGLLLLSRILRCNTNPVKFPVAFILEQSRGKLRAVVARPVKGAFTPKASQSLVTCKIGSRSSFASV
jgi:hypothetical protein